MGAPSCHEPVVHPCLAISEILREIFYFLDDRHDLAALARTCRAFMDLALDRLWHELPDFTILICFVLPESRWQIVPPKEINPRPILNIVASPSVNEWKRFAYYATRVKKLFYNTRFSVKKYAVTRPLIIAREALELILEANPCESIHPTRILPALRDLVWCPCYEDPTDQIRYFAAGEEGLRKLTINWHDDRGRIEGILSRFGGDLPVPTAIALSTEYFPFYSLPGCFSTLGDLQVLEVHCTTMEYRYLHDLCQLPRMVVVRLGVETLYHPTRNDALAFFSMSWGRPFPSLKCLDLHSPQPQVINYILGLLKDSRLEALGIHCGQYPRASQDEEPIVRLEALEQLSISANSAQRCAGILRKIACWDLRVLDIEIFRTDQEPAFLAALLSEYRPTLTTLYLDVLWGNPNDFPKSALQALSGLSRLVHVEISISGHACKPSDEMRKALKDACPGLVVFEATRHDWKDYTCLCATQTGPVPTSWSCFLTLVHAD